MRKVTSVPWTISCQNLFPSRWAQQGVGQNRVKDSCKGQQQQARTQKTHRKNKPSTLWTITGFCSCNSFLRRWDNLVFLIFKYISGWWAIEWNCWKWHRAQTKSMRRRHWRGLLWICAAQLHKIRKTKNIFCLSTETLYISFPSITPETILHPHSGFHKCPPRQSRRDLLSCGQGDGGDSGRVCSEPCCYTQIPSKSTGLLQRGPSVSKRNDSHWHLLPPCTFEETFSNWL